MRGGVLVKDMEVLRSAVEALERDLRGADGPKKGVRKPVKKGAANGRTPRR